MAHAARQVGVDTNDLSEILRDMNDRVGDFVQTGGGPMKDFFEQIAPKVGVTAEQFKKLSGPESLQLYVSSLHKANLNQKEMTFYMEALSSRSTELLPLFKNGGVLLNQYANEAEKLGLVISGYELSKLKEMDVQFKNMAASFEFVRARIAAQLIPWIQALMQTIAQASGSSVDFAQVTNAAIDHVLSGVGFLADAFSGVKRVLYAVNIAAVGALAGVANLVDASIKLMDKFLSFALFVPKKVLSAVNKIRALLGADPFELPKLSDTEFAKDAEKFAENLAGVLEQAKLDADAAWMEELPSESITRWADRVELEAARARDAFIASNAEITGDQAVSEVDEKERENLDAQKKWDEYKAQQKQDYLSRVQSMIQDQYGWEQSAAYEQGRAALQQLSTHNKKAFQMNKVAGIAEALIATYQGIAEAMKLPWPVNLAAAAATAAMGFAQVQAIRSQQFNGGGGRPATASAAQSSASATSATQQPQASTFTATIERTGEGAFLSESAMDTIFENINERLRDGQQLSSIGFSS
ncbi:MAG: hypothetical protein D6711_13765 [Chloroflexi bacterium]|nr:MAG: hypothetical protein D6711_13765 [Chloroflexota bacterium]